MKVEQIKQTKIELDGADADNFKSALVKIAEEEKKPGFNRQFLSSEERDIIKKSRTKLNNVKVQT